MASLELPAGLAMATASAVVAVLLRAGLEKVADRRAVAATLEALGLPRRSAAFLAVLIASIELATAIIVLFAPHQLWTQAAVAVLGSGFAAAGLAALLQGRRVRCNCFGTGAATGVLGSAQIMALPAWLGAAMILHYGASQPPSIATASLLLAAIAMAIAAAKIPALLAAVREARGDRLSAQEMYVWLPPR